MMPVLGTASLRVDVGTQLSDHGVVATGEHDVSSSSFGLEGHVRHLRDADAMKEHSQFSCHGNDSSVPRLLATSSSQMEAAPSKGRVFPLRPEYAVGTLDQKTSSINIAGLGDAELRISIPRLAPSRSQAKVANRFSTPLGVVLKRPRSTTSPSSSQVPI